MAGLPGFQGNGLHVVVGHAHVFGGNVLAVQVLDALAVQAQQGLGFHLARVADDDGLAPAQVEARDGIFEGHPPGQAQHVGEGLGLGGVVPHAGAAHARPQHAVVHGNDGLQAGGLVVAVSHQLVAHLLHLGKYTAGVSYG
jgi:hypothetical protein